LVVGSAGEGILDGATGDARVRLVRPGELAITLWTDPASHQRTVWPACRNAALTSPIEISPKWKMLAASTASAPAVTAGAKSSTRPAPPDAITGTSPSRR